MQGYYFASNGMGHGLGVHSNLMDFDDACEFAKRESQEHRCVMLVLDEIKSQPLVIFADGKRYGPVDEALVEQNAKLLEYTRFIKSCIASGEVPDTFEKFEAHLNSTK